MAEALTWLAQSTALRGKGTQRSTQTLRQQLNMVRPTSNLFRAMTAELRSALA
jgi:hypothetical protein